MAEKKFFVDINLQGSALTNAKIGTNTGIGSTEGAFGYDSAAHRLQYFDGTATKEVANLSDIAAVTGGLIFQGGYDPTTNTPDITDGSALKGFFWAVTAAGTFLGESVQVGDSIVAKVDNAGTTLSDWLILQGNIVVATDSVDGISRLATQTEANDGTESGAVVITPATLQGKIDAQITPEISSKLPLAGGTMSGNIHMGNNDITNAADISTWSITTNEINSTQSGILVSANLSLDGNIINNLAEPINNNDAARKGYVDATAATAQANAEATASADATAKADAAQAAAEAYADSLAPNYDAAGSAAQALTDANAYTDTGLAAKLSLSGGTMSGDIDMSGRNINGALGIQSFDLVANNMVTSPSIGIDSITALNGDSIQLVTGVTLDANGNTIFNLPAPTNDGDAANKLYVDDAASTAESNANAYTDTEIAARSYSSTILTSAWELNMDGSYSVTITHNLNLASTYGAVINFYNDNNGESELVELAYRGTSVNSFIVVSNFLPTSTMAVSIIKA